MSRTRVDKAKAKKFLKNALQLIPSLLRLLYRLLRDDRVSPGDKLIVAAAIAYVLLPFDVIPDFIPFFGQVDDIYVVALALLRLLHHSDESVLRENWDGPGDIVKLLEQVRRMALFFLPRRVQEILLGVLRHH
ncbi:MAG: DUF1232 domain-containing protein [Acidobacteria bacterium]|nr:DUF1232 domain-containing protein [Acidobacteriota bacterium]MBI3655404.1 DUF1232 domain-containing protein [Acidobacteriota bacterium]